VTPASGLTLPTSTIRNAASEALSVKILHKKLLVENRVIMDAEAMEGLLKNESEVSIKPLYKALLRYAEEAKKSSERFGREFSGQITIQGDADAPYILLKKVMYTCSLAGYPVIKLLVYKDE